MPILRSHAATSPCAEAARLPLTASPSRTTAFGQNVLMSATLRPSALPSCVMNGAIRLPPNRTRTGTSSPARLQCPTSWAIPRKRRRTPRCARSCPSKAACSRRQFLLRLLRGRTVRLGIRRHRLKFHNIPADRRMNGLGDGARVAGTGIVDDQRLAPPSVAA